ncbi:response regulator [uncultured Amnibacterium sp.]|uniref:response regulator n=1 Tax=uncultured Amnibacterium sp. TaxID=1631851 RepID=UPI0035CA47DE
MKVVVADDDPQILAALRILLRAHGYELVLARTGKQALDAAAHDHPDLVMLDLGMPQLNGIEVIRAIRGWSRIPILVVSGRTDSADKVAALDAGADDYVTKPFAADELLARIRALTRRIAADDASAAPAVRFGDVAIDLASRRVTRGVGGTEQVVRLTPTEWAIIELLLRHPGRLVTQRTVLSEVWGPGHANDTGYLRLYLAQLRKKLEPDPSRPKYLLTEPGMGYRFVPEPATEPTQH